MQTKIKNSRGLMFSVLIIVISFVYAINVQPVVFGGPSNLAAQYKSNDLIKTSPSNNHENEVNDVNIERENSNTLKKTGSQKNKILLTRLSIIDHLNVKNFFKLCNRIIILTKENSYSNNENIEY